MSAVIICYNCEFYSITSNARNFVHYPHVLRLYACARTHTFVDICMCMPRKRKWREKDRSGGWLISARGLVTSHPRSPYNTDNGRPTTINSRSFTLENIPLLPTRISCLVLKFPIKIVDRVSSFLIGRDQLIYLCLFANLMFRIQW